MDRDQMVSSSFYLTMTSIKPYISNDTFITLLRSYNEILFSQIENEEVEEDEDDEVEEDEQQKPLKFEILPSKDIPGDECPICIVELTQTHTPDVKIKIVRLPCNHLFHHDCLVAWLKVKNNCPICRYSET